MFRNTHTCESNLPDVVGFIDAAADVAVDSWSAEDMIFFLNSNGFSYSYSSGLIKLIKTHSLLHLLKCHCWVCWDWTYLKLTKQMYLIKHYKSYESNQSVTKITLCLLLLTHKYQNKHVYEK